MQLVGPAPRWRILWRGRRDWMTRRFGKPQKSGSFGQGKSRCSLHTRKSGTRWSTSALFHSRLPVWPQRRACRRRRRAASPLGAFQNSHAITQAQCQLAFLLAPLPGATSRSTISSASVRLQRLRLGCRSGARLIPILATRHGRARPGSACLWTDILNPL